ncbi:pyridoxal-phosphate dependent enzyme, partial [Deinococcus pimensis]|uniref:pyridoxal-phosphate dependent enzyme n=1 Tax=Deinococcus pimensis TaxID=309888 RepID=UPI000483D314
IALGKLAQAVVYGAQVVAIRGNFDDALTLVRRISEERPISLVNSVNPHRLEGQKTAAFEIVDVLGRAPDVLALPVGNAGNISAYHKGFREYHARGRLSSLPRLFGIQAAGASP